MNQNQQWLTCAPKNFRGCDIYSNRDAGLVAEGFKANGHDCRCVLLAPERDCQLPGRIRATLAEMQSPEWWRAWDPAGVIFYNSFELRYHHVVRGAKEAGFAVAMNIDHSAIMDFHLYPGPFLKKCLTIHSHRNPARRLVDLAAAIFKSYYRRWNGRHKRVAAHLANADVIAAVTPDSAERLKVFLKAHGQPEAAGRVHLIPHPAHPRFVAGPPKAADGGIHFVTVGRWDDFAQKRPDILMKVVDELLDSVPESSFKIFGKYTAEMEEWHRALPEEKRSRVGLLGVHPNAGLLEAFQSSHVYLCVSAFESFLIAGAEAMCCGCSMVAFDTPVLPGPRWFAQDSRGTLCATITAAALARAAAREARAWLAGERDAGAIAAWAQSQMHADRVAESYAKLLSSRS